MTEEYVLIVQLAGVNYRDEVRIVEDHPDKLIPTFITEFGRVEAEWERYGDKDDFVEVRRDHVVKRRIRKIQRQEEIQHD